MTNRRADLTSDSVLVVTCYTLLQFVALYVQLQGVTCRRATTVHHKVQCTVRSMWRNDSGVTVLSSDVPRS